jgi:hypothetical protein
MAQGSTYPVEITTSDGTIVKQAGEIVFTNSANQPQAGGNAITSGSLPNTGAWVSGTAKVNPVARAVTTVIEVVGDATNNAASVTIALSPDNSTYTTIATPSLAAAVNNTGAVTLDVTVPWPQGWYIKLTIGAHATVAASIYW